MSSTDLYPTYLSIPKYCQRRAHLADAIAEHNALVDALATSEAERERLSAALERYGQHESGCQIIGCRCLSCPCTCGLYDALSGTAEDVDDCH